MKVLLIVAAAAALCFAATESRVSRATRFRPSKAPSIEAFATRAPDPYDVLGTARGTYLEGYGTLFTVELRFGRTPAPLDMNPFRPVISPQEIGAIRERKLKKLPVLRGEHAEPDGERERNAGRAAAE